MKKILTLLLFGFVATSMATAVMPAATAAYNPFDEACNSSSTAKDASSLCKTDGSDPLTNKDHEGILSKITRLVSYMTGAASVIMIIVGGIQYILSTGDPNKITSAKNTILYAVIGLIITAIAQVLVRFVLNSL